MPECAIRPRAPARGPSTRRPRTATRGCRGPRPRSDSGTRRSIPRTSAPWSSGSTRRRAGPRDLRQPAPSRDRTGQTATTSHRRHDRRVQRSWPFRRATRARALRPGAERATRIRVPFWCRRRAAKTPPPTTGRCRGNMRAARRTRRSPERFSEASARPAYRRRAARPRARRPS